MNLKTKRFVWLGVIWAAIVGAALLLHEILLPFIFAALLAFVLDPVVTFMGRVKWRNWRMPRYVAVLTIYVGVVFLFYLLGVFFLPQLYAELVKLLKMATDYINEIDENQIHQWAQQLSDFLYQYNLPVDIDFVQVSQNMVAEVTTYLQSKSTEVVTQIHLLIASVVNFLFKTVLVFMIAAFILVDTTVIKKFASKLVLAEDKAALDDLLKRMAAGLSGVVRGQLLICFINAVLTLIGLLLLQIKFALILATLAGVLSLIPIFGSIISTIPIALVALSNSPTTALFAVLWIIMIHAIEANFLNPKIMGKAAKIHPVLIVLALLTGEHYFGLAGALLAVPIASIIVNLFYTALRKTQDSDMGVAKA